MGTLAIDQTQQSRQNRWEDENEAARRKVIQEETALRLAEEAGVRAQAEEQRRAQEHQVKTQLPLAATDAMQWMVTPDYQVPYEKAPEEARQHFFNAYDPEVAARAPQLWNDAVAKTTGKIPGTEGLEPHSMTVGPDGSVQRQFAAPTTSTTGQITEKDVADAGVDPNSIPRNQWAQAVAKAKAGREGKMTEMQSNALQYSARMAYQRNMLDKLEKEGFDPASIATGVQNVLPNPLRDEKVQLYRAARDNWIAAVLRKESGAAISESEYRNAFKQYFPQMGDTPAVVEQKKQLRKIAEDNMKLVAGGRASEAETGAPEELVPPAGPAVAPTQVPTLTTKAQFDALQSGQEYIRDGQRYRKP